VTDPADMIYLDHASTSWPKPPEVIEAVMSAFTRYGGNAGRGAYSFVLETSRAIESARADVAALLGVSDVTRISFQPSATQGMNLALFGLIKPGDRVVVSGGEHNSVRRPLNRLAAQGVTVEVVATDAAGYADLDGIEEALTRAPARAVVCQHVSNLSGAIQPVADLADIAHAHGAILIVDGAQAAGHIPVNLEKLGVDAWASSGHKGMLGPSGTGVLYCAPGTDPSELVSGGGPGSGDEPFQPIEQPSRYESGTMNTPGILGLGAGCRYMVRHGVEIRKREEALTQRLLEGLAAIPGMRVLGPELGEPRAPLVSVVHDSVDPDRLAFELDRRYGIAARAGMHCTPWSHRSLGTVDSGALRLSVGFTTTGTEVEAAIEALRELAAELTP